MLKCQNVLNNMLGFYNVQMSKCLKQHAWFLLAVCLVSVIFTPSFTYYKGSPVCFINDDSIHFRKVEMFSLSVCKIF